MLQSSLLYSCFSSSYLGNLSGSKHENCTHNVLFIFPFTLFSILGMNLFGCKFCERDADGLKMNCDRKNFDSLLWATVTVFQVSSNTVYPSSYALLNLGAFSKELFSLSQKAVFCSKESLFEKASTETSAALQTILKTFCSSSASFISSYVHNSYTSN